MLYRTYEPGSLVDVAKSVRGAAARETKDLFFSKLPKVAKPTVNQKVVTATRAAPPTGGRRYTPNEMSAYRSQQKARKSKLRPMSTDTRTLANSWEG